VDDEQIEPNKQYLEKEYPDLDEVEELEMLSEYDETHDVRRSPFAGVLKVLAVLMGVVFIVSILLPALGPLLRDDQRQTEDSSMQEPLYMQWIVERVDVVLSQSELGRGSQVLGVQFNESIDHPVIGVLVPRLDHTVSFPTRALQNSSIVIFQRMFEDERARSVTLAWFTPAISEKGGESLRELVLVVGLVRQTAEEVEWSEIKAENLRQAVDFYEEVHPSKSSPVT
jgi:hypothetical protein